MCDEIRMFRLLGANGVVIGALTPDGDLDMEKIKRMMDQDICFDMVAVLHYLAEYEGGRCAAADG